MIVAAGYVLLVPESRRELLVTTVEVTGRDYVGEPVPDFEHSRRAPLVVFASFEDGMVTHVASGRKGMPGSGGTGMIRLNLHGLHWLTKPISFQELSEAVPARFKARLAPVLGAGGLLPPRTFAATIDAMIEADPTLADRFARYSAHRGEIVGALRRADRENLALQKESVSLALRIAGMDAEEVVSWSPAADRLAPTFLEGLPGAVVREDAMVISDFGKIPGYDAVKDLPFAAKEFVDSRDPESKLVVIMANRLPLEEQPGAD